MQSLSDVINRLPMARLELLAPDIRVLIGRFYHKRRRDLTAQLNARLSGIGVQVPRQTPLSPTGIPLPIVDYSHRLDELRDKHIFQWNTFYRDTLEYILKDLQGHLRRAEARDAKEGLLTLVAKIFADHASAIFLQGHRHVIEHVGLTAEAAEAKSISGLQRFLFLLMDQYAQRRAGVFGDPLGSQSLRDSVSAALSGILTGYARCRLGRKDGANLIEKHRAAWTHALAFNYGPSRADTLGS